MILHLDMDAFFAAVEQLDNPELRGRPVIVGGGERGVVATASYEARVYGIHSAMPSATARKLCPHAVFLRGRYARYKELSHKVMETLRRFSPIVQAASIDEAYLDVGEFLRSNRAAPEFVALQIQKSVFAATGGLTCSIGIAPVKFLAKICSDINKPAGIYILRPEEMDEFLTGLPVEKLPGVGKRMRASLNALGVTRVGQLRDLTLEFMSSRYGKWGAALHERAFGVDPRTVHENNPAKSESVECTFRQDISRREELENAMSRHAEKIAATLKKRSLKGRTVTVKIKFSDFRIITRSKTLPHRTDEEALIYQAAQALLAATPLPKAVRLIGVGISGFDPRAEQLFLPGLSSAMLSRRVLAFRPA